MANSNAKGQRVYVTNASDIGGGGSGLTDTELRATPVPVSLGTDTDVIGRVGIDQTTPGTTNAVVAKGTAADNSVASGNPVQTGGVAVTGSSYAPAYTAGDQTVLAVDKDSGGLLAHTRTLTSTDVVTIVPKGAANQASGQVATSTSAATFVAARATRRSVTLKNLDAVITVYVGPATVTSGNGMPLRAGESISIDTVALIQVIAASGTPSVAYYETYD